MVERWMLRRERLWSPLSMRTILPTWLSPLTDTRHANRLYEVTGPRALTFAEVVETIAQAVGRPISYKQIGADEFAAGMR